jgi:hypothetical protein
MDKAIEGVSAMAIAKQCALLPASKLTALQKWPMM